LPIEACTFIGSSPIRQYAEGWTLDRMLGHVAEAVSFAVGEGLPVMMVTEDTTRANPDTLRALYGAAIDCGAKRLCIADTVGHATPDGARALVRFVIEEIVGALRRGGRGRLARAPGPGARTLERLARHRGRGDPGARNGARDR
jgi:isopropylmalate/homocitrate/citramalate synthase